MASGNNIGSDFADVFVAAISVGLFVAGLFVSVFAVPAGLLVFFGYKAWKNHYNSPPQRERRAREHVQQLYRDTLKIVPRFPDKAQFAIDVCDQLPALPEVAHETLIEVILDLYDGEHFGEEVPPPPVICDGLEGQHYIDLLSNYAAKAHHPHAARVAIETTQEALLRFLSFLPGQDGKALVSFSVPVASTIDRDQLGWCIRDVMLAFHGDEPEKAIVFRTLRKQLDRNFDEIAGPDRKTPYTPPQEYTDDDIIDRYLHGTPLRKLFAVQIPFSIPERPWFEGAWLLAPPGAGKTQTLQYLISEQLDRVGRDECSLIVIDGKGDLFDNLPRLKMFAEGEPLADRLVLVEPDVEHPLALNPFDLVTLEAPDAQRQAELRNNSMELLTYVFSSLLGEGATMTTMQTTLYRAAIRLLMTIEGATLDTFLDILKRDGEQPYQEEIERLDPHTQRFFREQWNAQEFRQRKNEIAWRLHTMLQNAPLLAAMFSAKKSRFSLYDELASGKVICINTSKAVLGEQGCEIFGRFFIAMLLAASQRRSMIGRSSRLPVFAYIDECHDYIKSDEKVATILDQARSMNISLVMAHQRASQIKSANVLDALTTTAIKFAHTDNYGDASMLAKAMQTKADFITAQPEQHFALSVRNHTTSAVSVRVPFFVMEKMEKMTDGEYRQVREAMHMKYCTVPQESSVRVPPPAPEPPDDGPDDLHHADTAPG